MSLTMVQLVRRCVDDVCRGAWGERPAEVRGDLVRFGRRRLQVRLPRVGWRDVEICIRPDGRGGVYISFEVPLR